MKKWFKTLLSKSLDKRIIGIPILAHIIAIAFAMISVTVIASSFLTIPSSITITNVGGGGGTPTPTYDIETYSDSACTIPLTEIAWGEVDRSSYADKTIYIKNVGNQAASIEVSITDIGDGIILTSNTPLAINPGEIGQLDLTVTIASTAALGLDDFNTVIINTNAP